MNGEEGKWLGSYRLVADQCTVSTKGLPDLGFLELAVSVPSPALLLGAERLIAFLVNFQQQFNTRIQPNQTVAFGYWTIRLVAGAQGRLDVWEVKSEQESHTFVPGADRALTYWLRQESFCHQVGAKLDPPHASHTVAISAGVLEGTRPLEGVRYPAKKPQSGWYLTTDLYDGNIQSMKGVHLEHLTRNASDLLDLIGLPPGYRFELRHSGEVDVWLDPEVLRG